MCYSFRTSLISYSLGIISGIFALCTRQIVLGTLILAYSQMQLAELMIWKGIDDNNISLNKTGTSFGKYLLATHNIAIGLGIIVSLIVISKKKVNFIDFLPLIIGIVFFLFIVFYYYLPKKYPDITLPLDPKCIDTSNKCQNPNNRLKWPWPHGWYLMSYLISVILMIVYIKPVYTKIWLAFIFSASFAFMAIFRPTVVGSLWCFSTAILAPLIVIINYFLIKDKSNSELLS